MGTEADVAPDSVLSENWRGCPAESHNAKAAGDLPTYCEGARCFTSECCLPRGTCNSTEICNEQTHVPYDRGVLCEDEVCIESECCEPKATCEEAVCVSATHAFDETLTGTLCWGPTCMESECCSYRDSCTLAACGDDNANMRVKPSLADDFLCTSLECTADECCEWEFDAYKRTTDYLTTPIVDTASYPTARDAFTACGADANCDGFTCPVGGTDGDGQAVGPCFLRALGSTSDGTVGPEFKVSFISVTCSQSICETDANLTSKGDDLPSSCAGDQCTPTESCDERG